MPKSQKVPRQVISRRLRGIPEIKIPTRQELEKLPKAVLKIPTINWDDHGSGLKLEKEAKGDEEGEIELKGPAEERAPWEDPESPPFNPAEVHDSEAKLLQYENGGEEVAEEMPRWDEGSGDSDSDYDYESEKLKSVSVLKATPLKVKSCQAKPETDYEDYIGPWIIKKPDQDIAVEQERKHKPLTDGEIFKRALVYETLLKVTVPTTVWLQPDSPVGPHSRFKDTKESVMDISFRQYEKIRPARKGLPDL